jgi:nucleoside-diphosphate-sugar epimerase
MSEILICGASSFVARGVLNKLGDRGYVVDCYSRGNTSRDGVIVRGDYLSIASNKMLKDHYDIVINYAVLKDGSVESNLLYIKSLIQMCIGKGVTKLIHFSSVMVYGYHESKITENSPVDSLDETWKKGYGEFKIAVDQYFMSIRDTLPFELVLVRPGYVLADNRPCPFIIPLPLGFTLIKGNSKSKQPIVKREEIHKALVKIIETEKNLHVYHFFPNDGMTKFRFAKMLGYKRLIPMPKWLFKGIPFILMKICIMSKSFYSRFDGMYNESEFSSELTEKKLHIKFS